MRWLLLLVVAASAFAQSAPPPDTTNAFTCLLYEVQPILIGGLDSLQARVVYPEAAREGGVEGRVVVQIIVTEAGEVTDAVVVQSPNPLLNAAALAAVEGSRFVPGTQRGDPVPVRFAVPIVFRLPK